MNITSSKYIGSYPTEAKSPPPKFPEYAFIGRSNVGKSSLINMLTQRKSLAHVSKTPGKTQKLNFYLIDETWYLVDLPGYGYAVTSKKNRSAWGHMIQTYLSVRSTLSCAFVLVDTGVPPQKIDIEFINWMGEAGVPFVIVFTKMDKMKPREVTANTEAFKAALLEHWDEMPQYFITSSEKQIGRDEILGFIESVNSEIKKG